LSESCSFCGTYRHKLGCPILTKTLFLLMGGGVVVLLLYILIAALTHSVSLNFRAFAAAVLAVAIAILISVLKRPK